MTDKSESKRGGRRPGAGRPKGRTKAVILADKRAMEEACRQRAAEAIEAICDLMTRARNETVRLNAANSILDRAYVNAEEAADEGTQNQQRKPMTEEESRAYIAKQREELQVWEWILDAE